MNSIETTKKKRNNLPRLGSIKNNLLDQEKKAKIQKHLIIFNPTTTLK